MSLCPRCKKPVYFGESWNSSTQTYLSIVTHVRGFLVVVPLGVTLGSARSKEGALAALRGTSGRQQDVLQVVDHRIEMFTSPIPFHPISTQLNPIHPISSQLNPTYTNSPSLVPTLLHSPQSSRTVVNPCSSCSKTCSEICSRDHLS